MAETGAAAYYRLYAARCLEMSREDSNAPNRASLLAMAQVWMALADQADRSNGTASAAEQQLKEEQVTSPGRPQPES